MHVPLPFRSSVRRPNLKQPGIEAATLRGSQGSRVRRVTRSSQHQETQETQPYFSSLNFEIEIEIRDCQRHVILSLSQDNSMRRSMRRTVRPPSKADRQNRQNERKGGKEERRKGGKSRSGKDEHELGHEPSAYRPQRQWWRRCYPPNAAYDAATLRSALFATFSRAGSRTDPPSWSLLRTRRGRKGSSPVSGRGSARARSTPACTSGT